MKERGGFRNPKPDPPTHPLPPSLISSRRLLTAATREYLGGLPKRSLMSLTSMFPSPRSTRPPEYPKQNVLRRSSLEGLRKVNPNPNPKVEFYQEGRNPMVALRQEGRNPKVVFHQEGRKACRWPGRSILHVGMLSACLRWTEGLDTRVFASRCEV